MFKKIAPFAIVAIAIATFFFAKSFISADSYSWQFSKQAVDSNSQVWDSVAISPDGTKLIAASTKNIYTSTNGGATWTLQSGAGIHSWIGLASSDNGSKLLAAVYSGGVYRSVDGGVNWSVLPSAGTTTQAFLASSADGSKLALAANGGYIEVSSDGGSNWAVATSTGMANWVGITSSANGTRMAALANGGDAWISVDGGATWTDATSTGPGTWNSIASSADGMTIAIAGTTAHGNLLISTDGGATWTNKAPPGAFAGESVAMSANGLTLMVSDEESLVHTSIDGGATWVDQPTFSNNDVDSVVMSGDGTKSLLLASSGNVYLGGYENGPSLIINAPAQDPFDAAPISSFSASISWDTSTSCQYSYDGITYSTVSCAAAGSDIPAPTSNNLSTLYIKGTDGAGTSVVVANFYYSGPVISFPSAGATIQLWAPALSWGDAPTACEYSYDGSTYHPANCALSGSDIPPPAQAGTSTLYIRSTASDSSKTVVSSQFSYQPQPNWVADTSLGAREWGGLASSADGSHLAAAVSGGDIYTSADGGVTWIDRTSLGSMPWVGIASSADGMDLAAAASGGDIFTSSDGGATWTDQSTAGSRQWVAIASSADGSHLAAAVSGGDIYTSANYGAAWTDQTSSGSMPWVSISSSANGMTLAAIEISNSTGKGYIYTSLDGGGTWTQDTAAGNRQWTGVAVSGNGSLIVATDQGNSDNGDIWTSSNGGANWTDQTSAGSRDWLSVTVSNDGSRIAAVDQNADQTSGDVWTSTNGGSSWTDQSIAGGRLWQSVTSSSDGTHIAAQEYLGYLFTYSLSSAPQISNVRVSADSQSASVSWTTNAPSSSLVNYGLTSSYGNSSVLTDGGAGVLSHFVTLSNLSTCATYHFNVQSSDASTTDMATSTDYSFATSGCTSGSASFVPTIPAGTGQGSTSGNSQSQSGGQSVTSTQPSSAATASSSATSTPTVTVITATTTPVVVAPAAPAQTTTLSSVLAAGFRFLHNLQYHDVGADVLNLQAYLKQEGFFSVDPIGIFGPITYRSLVNYQAAHSIVPASGYFGDTTRGVVNQTLP